MKGFVCGNAEIFRRDIEWRADPSGRAVFFVGLRLLAYWDRGFDAPIPVAVRSKALVYGRLLTEIVGTKPTGSMDVCVVFVVGR
jgi:hypothetical protein